MSNNTNIFKCLYFCQNFVLTMMAKSDILFFEIYIIFDTLTN